MKRIFLVAGSLAVVVLVCLGAASISYTTYLYNINVATNTVTKTLTLNGADLGGQLAARSMLDQPAVNISASDIDLVSTNRVFGKSLGADTTFTFSNLANGQRWMVILTNGASWTVTWPTVTWMAGSAPVMDTGAGTVNTFVFQRQGGVTFGDVSQKSNANLDAWALLATSAKQDTLTAGTGIGISPDNTIIATNVVENALTLTDNTTNNASTTAHGFLPKLPNDATQALLGTGFGKLPVEIGAACSDETTALTATAGKVSFRMPHAMTVTSVRASLVTAQASGNIFTVDINEGGVSILSTKITIDNTELTSTTAAAAPVISDSALADDAIITVDVDQIGDGTAKGLKIWLIGTR